MLWIVISDLRTVFVQVPRETRLLSSGLEGCGEWCGDREDGSLDTDPFA